MPPDHDELAALVATVRYYFIRGGKDRSMVRALLVEQLSRTDTNRVGMALLYGCREIIKNIDTTGGRISELIALCGDCLRRPALASVGEKTWGEQIAGMAALAAKRQWPELRDF